MRKRYRQIRAGVSRWANRVHIPGYPNVTLYTLWAFYIEALWHGQLGMRSAGISFRFLTALFPLCIFLFSIIPFIPVEGLQEDMMLGLKNFFPNQIYIFFHQVLTDLIVKKHTVLLSLGFILSIYFASNAVEALIEGLNSSYHVYRQKNVRFLKQKIVSMVVLLVIFALFLFSFVIAEGGQWFIDYLYDHNIIHDSISYWLLIAFKMALSFMAFMLCITVIYNVANTDKVHWKYFSPGALMCTLLIFLLKEGFGLYLTYFGKFDQVYGPIGAGLAFLIFIFYLFMVIILGFELNTSLQKAYFKKNYTFEPGSVEFEEYKRQVRAQRKFKRKKR